MLAVVAFKINSLLQKNAIKNKIFTQQRQGWSSQLKTFHWLQLDNVESVEIHDLGIMEWKLGNVSLQIQTWVQTKTPAVEPTQTHLSKMASHC